MEVPNSALIVSLNVCFGYPMINNLLKGKQNLGQVLNDDTLQ